MQCRLSVCAVVCSLLVSFLAPAESVFNKNLSAAELAQIEQGATLIKNTGSVRQLCMQSPNQGVRAALKAVSDLKPAYLAEIIQMVPYSGNEDFITQFRDRIMRIEEYAGIPYYSERHQSWYDLYSSATLTSFSTEGEQQRASADLVMQPFGTISTRIENTAAADYFLYTSTNTNRLRYHDKFTCVNPEKMLSVIVIFRDGDSWILYGIGAVHAPSVFFLRERVETSFMNRIKSFCSYFFSTVQKK
ncbi:MAG: hypothetical protein J1D88_03615 [Treponema sp.]|nr:hypothetical protein [Treponema sp.]